MIVTLSGWNLIEGRLKLKVVYFYDKGIYMPKCKLQNLIVTLPITSSLPLKFINNSLIVCNFNSFIS